jgi:hypothetical protein
MDELILTPYGEVRAEGLAELQGSFDTRQMLAAVDDLDRFYAQWKRELRADLLRLHGMAHTVINGAPLASVPGEEGLSELAFSIADEFRDWQQSLRSTIAQIKSQDSHPTSPMKASALWQTKSSALAPSLNLLSQIMLKTG